MATGATAKKVSKVGKAASPKEKLAEGPEGVVYKVGNTFSITLYVT